MSTIRQVLQKRTVLWVCVAVIFGLLYLPNSGASSSIGCTNGECTANASLDPLVLIPTILALGLILVFRNPPVRHAPEGEVKKRHIFAAWIIDFFLVMFALTPLAAAIPLVLESIHSGQIVGSFERDYLRVTDTISSVAVLLLLAAMAIYFGRSASGKHLTVGQYLLRFRVQADPSLTGWRRGLGVMFHPWLLVMRPIETGIGIRRSPTFSFGEIEAARIE